jgi:hypothetical protein
MIYNKNKNSLETAFLGKKFPWNGIPWKKFPCCGVPWKNFSLLWHSLERHSLEKKIPWSVVQPCDVAKTSLCSILNQTIEFHQCIYLISKILMC